MKSTIARALTTGCCILGALIGASLRAAEAPASSGALVSLRVLPQQATLWGAGASQRFAVLGVSGDGLERDVTDRCRFAVSDPRLARLEATVLYGLADGKLELTATLGNLTAIVHVRIEGSKERPAFSFARDIGEVLTRNGCNTSACHGSVKGKKGFKLSLDALYARDDYDWIVNGGIYEVLTSKQPHPRKPRIDRQKPAESLLLLKATAAVKHGGGERIAEGSADYHQLVDWIKRGAPYGDDTLRTVRVDIEPKQVVLESSGKQQLLVTGLLSNGRRQDFTGKVLYASNNSEVARVSAGGLVEAVRPGATALVVRAAGQVATVNVGVVTPASGAYAAVKANNFIDNHIFAKLRRLRVTPAPLSSDEEFMRRVCLDLTGTLPPPERVRAFLAERAPDKRNKLIDVLLDSPQYVDFWTYRFADLFRVNHTALQKLKRTFLHAEWVRISVAQNKPYDRIARERIAAQGYGGPTLHLYRVGDMVVPQELMAEEFRVFAGVRLECAQCHNHPFQAWSQDQFWGLAAFFAQMTVAGKDSDGLVIDFPAVGRISNPSKGRISNPSKGRISNPSKGRISNPSKGRISNPSKGRIENPPHGIERTSGKTLRHPRTKEIVQPMFLDGTRPALNDPADLRASLARWLTAPDNPFFARAAVNRLWGYFFGRGIVDPVDDFRSTNPPTHPELLDALAEHFKRHKFDVKDLIRTIVRSRTYQLSGAVAGRIGNPSYEEGSYARFRPRALDAVVLLDAISRVTGVEEKFHWDKFVGGNPTPSGTRAVDLIPEIAPCRFLDVYGRPNRQTLPEKGTQPNLGQALHMLAGTTYTEKIGQKGGRVGRLLKAGLSNRQIIEELYLAALCRVPTERERTDLEELMRGQPSRQEAVEALTWALLTSREFAYNH